MKRKCAKEGGEQHHTQASTLIERTGIAGRQVAERLVLFKLADELQTWSELTDAIFLDSDRRCKILCDVLSPV
jgi:hypothetical protein